MNKKPLFTAVAFAMAMCLAQRSVCDNVAKSNDVTFSIISPQDSSLWVATRSRGILRVGRTGRAFAYSSANGDFPCDNIVSLAFDSKAVLWMRDAEGGVYSYTSFEGFRKRNDVPDPVRSALWADSLLENVTFSKDKDELSYADGRSVRTVPALPFALLSLLLLGALLYLLRERYAKLAGSPKSIAKPKLDQKPEQMPEQKSEKKHIAVPETVASDPSEIIESDAFSAKVSEIIASNYTNPDFSVEQIADILGITRVHLNRKLKMENAPSPKDMLKKARMDKAAELLRQGIPVASIASECGFSSPSYFSSAFKEYFGVSPKSFE